MKTHIIRIGNSQGIRIPKRLLEQSGLEGEVELEVDIDRIVIHPVAKLRSEWCAAFAAMAECGDDLLLDQELPSTEWDESEWEWE